MSKRTLFKVTAIVVCFTILALSVPSAYAKHSPDRFDVGRFVKRQIAVFSSMLSFLPFFENRTTVLDEGSDDYANKIKITGGLKSDRPSGGD